MSTHPAKRLMNLKEAASHWGVSPNTFRKMYRTGIAPGPICIPGMTKLLFDKPAHDAAIDARSGVQSAKVTSSDRTWD
jgi:hypothetical protein